MKKIKFLLIVVAILIAVFAVYFVLSSEKTLLLNPKGMIAKAELELIIANITLMLIIIVPTYILLFTIVWKYCIKNEKTEYEPDHNFGVKGEILMWGLPTIIVIALGFLTWEATHHLDPYKPLKSDIKPLVIEVVAMDWKWLFIYPELGIATLNDFHIPERTPIHLKLTADGSPMNSFWIPQLSGQIYSMTGMTTQLHLIADGQGDYVGKAIEINGEGYSDMTFAAKSSSKENFDQWVADVKKSPLHLSDDVYKELIKPSINKSVILFSDVEKDLFLKIVNKYMYPTGQVL